MEIWCRENREKIPTNADKERAKNGDAYYAVTPVRKIRSNYEPHSVGTVVQLPSFDEFIEKHGDYLKLMLLEEILSKSPKRIPKDEEKK